jgi:hypothetical protein
MIEKEPESSSDIVDRAMGELRSSPVSSDLPPELLEVLLRAARENAGTEARTGEASAGDCPDFRGHRGEAVVDENGTVPFDMDIHPTLLTRSQHTWRWIMRSPVSRIAAAVIFIVALGGVAVWFHGGGTTPAFADFIAPILESKTLKYKLVIEMKGPPATTGTSEVMVLDATRSRQEMTMPNDPKNKGVIIFDWGRGKSLTLEPASKKALVLTFANLSKKQIENQDTYVFFRSILLDARDKPDIKREPLGEKDIDGKHVVGFRVNVKGMAMNLWGDPKTGLPVRVEMTMTMFGDTKATMTDFVFNEAMDESLFSVDPPAGYTVDRKTVDASAPEEKSLIETLREYCKLSGGAFPDSLDLQAITETVAKLIGQRNAIEMIYAKLAAEKKELTAEQKKIFEGLMQKLADMQPGSGKEKPNEKELEALESQLRKIAHRDSWLEKPNKEEMGKMMAAGMQKFMDAQVRIQRGVLFAVTLSPEADGHYAGKGIKLGEGDKPVFWYRPKDAKTYRVIYGDLSVRDADAAPNVPKAQRMADMPSLDQILRTRRALPPAKVFKPIAPPSDLQAPAKTITPKALEAPGASNPKK